MMSSSFGSQSELMMGGERDSDANEEEEDTNMGVADVQTG